MATSADAIQLTTNPAKRVKLFTGAPDPATLSWDEDSLLNDWTPPVRRFLKRKFVPDDAEHVLATASPWRSISTSRHAQLHTGFTQESPLRKDFLYAPTFAGAEQSFALSSQTSIASSIPANDGTTKPSRSDDDEDAQEEFIEHSIIVHDNTRSSQLAPDPTMLEHSFQTTTTSFNSSEFLSQEEEDEDELPSEILPNPQLPRHITPLRAVPPAKHLQRIVPQTVVISLIAGIISILPARTVRTRRGAQRGLVELLVGDETATGLKVSFWFDQQRGTGEEDALGEKLRGLRVQDVVLLENVALDTFRDKVFGYSLRKSMQKNQTRVELLARSGVDRFAGLAEVGKVGAVKDWVFGLVNPGGGGGRGEEGEGRGGEDACLPPDTQ